MTWLHLVLLVLAGLFGGFIGGLLGVGGGIIFAPVLLLYFQAIGVPATAVMPLTLGTSLLTVLIATVSSAYTQHRLGALRWPVALFTGSVSALIALVITATISTQSWYDKRVFQLFFGSVLILVVWRMLAYKPLVTEGGAFPENNRSKGLLMVIGSVSGLVSALTGVGGGTILVPAYHRFLQMTLTVATGTSAGTIIITASAAILAYVVQGWGVPLLPFSVGFVDGTASLTLGLPAMMSARWGVLVAHKINTKWLKRIFAVFVLLIALRMILNALFEV
ncbi:MAG TPA: sulfite exporter TauE/SafE family protein [Bacteroidetes bacterium]|nr:sulfite exporter TauE/SafE family protein [Bacteroidota bacterium]HRR08478.1 sulfite exporter TauE/SafE family protein [Rhodothermales bacterium]